MSDAEVAKMVDRWLKEGHLIEEMASLADQARETSGLEAEQSADSQTRGSEAHDPTNCLVCQAYNGGRGEGRRPEPLAQQSSLAQQPALAQQLDTDSVAGAWESLVNPRTFGEQAKVIRSTHVVHGPSVEANDWYEADKNDQVIAWIPDEDGDAVYLIDPKKWRLR